MGVGKRGRGTIASGGLRRDQYTVRLPQQRVHGSTVARPTYLPEPLQSGQGAAGIPRLLAIWVISASA